MARPRSDSSSRPKRTTLPLSPSAEAFLRENTTCTLTTLNPDGSPHVAPVRFTWDGAARLVRVMTVGGRRKVRNVLASPGVPVAVCQTVGGRWITLTGPATVSENPDRVAEGVRRYTKRYWSPPPAFPGMVVIEIAVESAMGLF